MVLQFRGLAAACGPDEGTPTVGAAQADSEAEDGLIMAEAWLNTFFRRAEEERNARRGG